MKYYQVFSVMTFVVFITLNISFGRSVKNSEKSIENKDFYKTLQKCRQIIDSDANLPGNINDSMQHICDPITSTQTTIKPNVPFFIYRIYDSINKRFETLIPLKSVGGINCRRHMNSELNELDEIIDTVKEICDLPTTTTRTTRKPIVKITTKVITTTAKPLVKVCRPVMNSYLSEEGEIIDSVTMVCKMEVMI